MVMLTASPTFTPPYWVGFADTVPAYYQLIIAALAGADTSIGQTSAANKKRIVRNSMREIS